MSTWSKDVVVTQMNTNTERPEVELREGIRRALRAGVSNERIKEIFESELINLINNS
jgi:hypothetical protein